MVTFEHCNSVEHAEISIEIGRLNIKYGMNGTGKSSIARAISLSINQQDLAELTPFKHRIERPLYKPAVTGAESFKSVQVFNEDYVQQFVFKEDEVVRDSFEIFIRNPDYEQKMEAIEKLVSTIKETFKKEDYLEKIITDLTTLSDSFGKSASAPSKAGALMKAISQAYHVENVPAALEGYKDFLKLPNNVKWIAWQISGNEFLDASTGCPYCTSPTEEKKEKIRKVGQTYNNKHIEHYNNLTKVINSLSGYFEEATLKKLNEILNNSKDGLVKAQEDYLMGVKLQVNTLREQLANLRDISYFYFNKGKEVEDNLRELKIDMGCLPHLCSPSTAKMVEKINGDIDGVLSSIGELKGQINIQRKAIEKTIRQHCGEINNFLKYAGYKYYVDIEEEKSSFKMRLKHHEFKGSISNSERCLSYGERNAFSLVLFMYECIRKNPDLIILDDPISSFDRNKKFAIIEMLFRRQDCLRGRTVLLLTHDFEPVIDMIGTLKGDFQPLPNAVFLKSQVGGLVEVPIDKRDILTFTQVCNENLADVAKHDILKLIHLRRFYEISNNKGDEYNVISSLLHKRGNATLSDQVTEMPTASVTAATVEIRARGIPNFDYANCLAFIMDDSELANLYKATHNNYEKLQIYRIYQQNKGEIHSSNVMQKFIHETFHIENDYVMQLNPSKYDFVPQYIVDECDAVVLPTPVVSVGAAA